MPLGQDMTRRWRDLTGLLWVAAGLAVLLLAGRLSAGSLPAAGPRAVPPPNSRVVGQVPAPARAVASGSVTSIAAGSDAMWAAGRCTLSRVDPDAARVVHVAGTGQSRADCVVDVAVGAGAVWGTIPGVGLVRVDAATNRVVARVPVGPMWAPVAATATGVWVVCCGAERGWADGVLVRVDPAAGRVAARIRLGGRPTGVAAGPSGVWVAGHRRVWRVDPRTGRVVATFAVADGLAAGGRVVVGRDAVWVGDWAGQQVLRLDPGSGRVVARAAGVYAVGVAVVGPTTWAMSPGGLVALGRDATRPVLVDGLVPSAVSDLAAGQGALWVAAQTGLFRVDAQRLR
jgi:outer membrane protein assembly factor BamB